MSSSRDRVPTRSAWGSRAAVFLAGLVASLAAPTAELPVPCVAGSCGATAPPGFVSAGSAGATVTGNTLRVDQASSSAILNWRSFNVSRDGTVTFAQPDRSAIALNRIYDANPSRVLGALNANGRVYLLNQNGIVFGDGAKVNVGGLVASSLDISPQALDRGIAEAINVGGSPAFQEFRDPSTGAVLPSGAVRVEQGAQIASEQGQVLLFAPEVANRGNIRTPDGQTILAAGNQVFLATSSDPNLRGLLVEVRGEGTVVNGREGNVDLPPEELVGRIVADRGNVTLAGLLVRQEGMVSATTSTRANGTVRLLARATSGTANPIGMRDETVADIGGTLQLGRGSVTAATLDAEDDSETVDVNTQPRSEVQLSGQSIEINSRARVVATAGTIDAYATERPNITPNQRIQSTSPDAGRIVVASDATLDVSGATVGLPMERNVIRVELRGNQLADSPLQRDGPLRSEAVFVDVRQYGTRDDGSSWVGTPIGDVAGDISNIRRGVAERNLEGGSIVLLSSGAVLVGRGARLNVSGGQIDWQSGVIRTSRVLGVDGRIYDIAEADRDREYLGLLDVGETVDPRWGVPTTTGLQDPTSQGVIEAGYLEGRDAGAITVAAPRLLLDGDVVGRTTVGAYQRLDPATAIPSAYDRLPIGARLTLGLNRGGAAPDFVVPDVSFDTDYVLPNGLGIEDVEFIEPEMLEALRLRSDLLGDDRAASLMLFSNGEVLMPADVPLALPSGGEFAVAAGRIVVQGDITVPAGVIGLSAAETVIYRGATPETTVSLHVSGDSMLDTRGTWVNDDPRYNPGGPQGALYTNGGVIAVSATGGPLELAEGSVLDVSAGAQLRADGAVIAGRGGSITILASTPSSARASELTLGAQLNGYALNRGGTLAVAANAICITAAECGATTPDLILGPEWFQSGGFGSIALDARYGGLELVSGTTVVLEQHNYELLPAAIEAPSAASLAGLVSVVRLPDHDRRPLNLTLRSGNRSRDTEAPASDLRIAAGSALLGDPLARVSLTSGSSAFIDGSVSAPGGSISLAIDNSNPIGYLAGQGIWIGGTAGLDASGVAVLAPTGGTQREGVVLDGGNVAITANRGFVVTDPGSVVDASGTRAQLDIRQANGLFTSRDIASHGGQITISAADGMLLNGALRGTSGQPGSVESGSLSLRLDVTGRAQGPLGDREILVAAGNAPVLVAPGQPLPDAWLGRGLITASAIEQGGFDSARLSATNVTDFDPLSGEVSLAGYGRIAVEAGVSLSLPVRLELAASSVGLAGGAGAATLAAPYLALTRDEFADPSSIEQIFLEAPEARAGSGQLTLAADFVNIFGSVTLDGVTEATIRSSGDIRFSGVLESREAREYIGVLRGNGALVMEAQQIYPSTLSRYTIAMSGEEGSSISVVAAPGQAAPVLSAGGALVLEASDVGVAGLVRAPLGEVILRGERVSLLDGGALSVSLDGQTVPFGTTQGDLAWAYELGNIVTLIYGPDGRPLPAKRVTLDGDAISIAQGGVIDLRGGGDLLGYEFVPGPGGTQDVLSNANADQFAVLPGANPPIAHYDPTESRGFSARPGLAVWLAGGGGLPEGTYTLLPSRYALLPGAYLVTFRSGYQDLSPGEVINTATGGKIVAGAFAVAGTSLRDSRTHGFEVRPGTAALTEARYDLSGANEYLSELDPTLTSTRLPRDAGAAALLAGIDLDLRGRLLAGADEDGRGSSLEIAAPNIVVTASDDEVPEGSVGISAESLAALGAQTIVLGGTTSVDAVNGTTLDVATSSLVIAGGVQLSAPELLLVAQELLRLEEGASVVAQGDSISGFTQLLVPDGVALLRASTDGQVAIDRPGVPGDPGRLELLEGSIVRAPGSITLDVDGSALVAGTLDAGSGSLGLGAPRIGLGAAPAGFDGVVVDDAVLASVAEGQLGLTARSELVLFAGTEFTTREAVIRTPSITAGTSEGTFTLVADRVELGGLGAGDGDGTVGAAELSLVTGTLVLSGGDLGLDGFQRASFSATEVIDAIGDGTLRTAGGLAIVSPLLTTAAAVDFRFDSGSDLELGALPLAEPSNYDWVERLGGSLEFSAATASGTLRAVLPSGSVALLADGDVTLGAETSIDVAGRSAEFDGVEVATPGGQVRIASSSGSIRVEPGGVIDVSAAPVAGALAGGLSLAARDGAVRLDATVLGAAPGTGLGGSIDVAARQLDFGALMTSLGSGGFDGDWNVMQTGPGDLVVESGRTITARSIRLTAEGGAVRVGGLLDARAARGGEISLAAAGPVAVSGTLDARATDEDVRGGRVELASMTGVMLQAGSVVNVAGTALSDPEATPGGLVTIRTSRDAFLSVIDGDAGNDQALLAGTITGTRRVVLEGVAVYEVPGGHAIGPDQVAASLENPWFADAAQFAGNGEQILAGLGLDTAGTAVVLPGLEVRADGNLTLATEWNLHEWRFGVSAETPGALTVRAAGDVVLDASLSDGFDSPFDTRVSEDGFNSWSYRLVAGAVLDSANPITTADGRLGGDFVLGEGVTGAEGLQRVLRTGTGNIVIAAARDVVLTNGASVVYTAGIPSAGIRIPEDPAFGGLLDLAYPVDAGDIYVRAGRDAVGGNASQFYTPWLLRAGAPDSLLQAPTGWTVDFGRFEQGIAAVGGGRVTVVAQRDVVDMSISLPSIGRQVGGNTFDQSVVLASAGGDLNVYAGRNVSGGQYYVDRGIGTITAQSSVQASERSLVEPVLAVGDATLALTSRRSLDIATALNPTLLWPADNFGFGYAPTYFGTYSSTSSLSMLAVGGDVRIASNPKLRARLDQQYPNYPWELPDASVAARIAPPTVLAAASSGALEVGAPISMWPAPRGNLRLLARGDVRVAPVTMSDAALGDVLPTPEQPGSDQTLFSLLFGGVSGDSRFNAASPVHGPTADDPSGDLEPARIVSLTGDVVGIASVGTLYVPKAVRVVAARDVSGLSVQMQHFDEGLVSTIQGGRDVIFPSERDQFGQLVSNNGAIIVDGPGGLQLLAGRDFDLQTSAGVVTRGSLRNRALPDGGADVSVTAGLNGNQPDEAAFAERYLAGGTLYDALLIEYVARITGEAPASKAEALAAFETFDPAQQAALLQAVLFAEIRQGGRDAAQPGDTNGDFTRAFTALETYFPGSNPDVDVGETNAYAGDIRLFFSRIYTLAGGNIGLMAPGGEINVGLATPPLAFGLQKSPSDLGIVVQSTGSVAALSYLDYQVNESRTFAADGGDILIWSTRGDIDAGRGAKTAISAPPPVITIDPSGQVVLTYPAALSGSGIQTLATSPDIEPGDVDLFAPRGVVDAGDAGIVAGNLTIAATAVLGANNIQVSGTSVGVPVDASGLGASLAGVSSVSSAASSAAEAAVAPGQASESTEESIGDEALSWLDVFVVGLGEEQCDPKDVECLRRQKKGE